MKKIYIAVAILAFLAICLAAFALFSQETEILSVDSAGGLYLVSLPEPALKGEVSVEESIAGRRSIRGYAPLPLTVGKISQLLWAAQGISGDSRFRTAPSAGALYPLEIYLVAGKVEGLSPGVYRYIPEGHLLDPVVSGDMREEICSCALNQSAVRDAPALIVITAIPSRTTGKYGERGMRYVYMEAGHAGQNVYLQAYSLHIGTVSIGAFHDECIRNVLFLGPDEIPIYIMPTGILP